MCADVAPYIPQQKERLTAEQTWPVLALDVSEAMHDQSVTALVGGGTLRTGVGRLEAFGDLTTWPSKLL